MASTAIDFTTYTEYTIDLSAYNGFHYIAFARKNAPADGWYLYVDDILIEDIPQAGLLTVNFRQQSRRKARTGPFLILSRGGVWDTLSRRKGWVWADAHGCADSSLKEEKLWDSGLTPISRL